MGGCGQLPCVIKRSAMLVIVLVFLTGPTSVISYPNGAPSEQCDSMIPYHGVPGQTTSAPYAVSFNKSTYSPNETIQVTLQGSGRQSFKGFFIQPRPNKNTYTTYGSITDAPISTHNPCGQMAALTHSDGSSKSSVTFTWTAPPSPSSSAGDLVFVFTVVEAKKVFWVKQVSSIIMYSGPNTALVGSNQAADESTITSETQGVITKEESCGKTLGCFHNCYSDNTCSFMLTWKDNGSDDIDMALSCQSSDNEYCAVGLSGDEEMGDDSVIQCAVAGNTIYVNSSYNVASGKSNRILNDPQFGLTNITASYDAGILRCTFSRKKTAALASANLGHIIHLADTDMATYKDMISDWFLMLATGTSINGGFMNKHSFLPLISIKRVHFQVSEDIHSRHIQSVLVKSHGMLMVVAWLLLSTAGIFVARFYKTVWPEGMEWFGNKRWFVIHRACLVLAVLLTVVSFIIIFVEGEGLSELSGSTFEKSHSIIGIIITCLAIINPIMSLFRPNLGNTYRPIFNWSHRIVGVTAQVCAVVNLFSGCLLATEQRFSEIQIPLWIFVGWVAIIEVSLLMFECLKSKGKDDATILLYKSKKEQTYELNGDLNDEKHPEEIQNSKVILMIIHFTILLVLMMAVCIMLA